jgi:hypothetical protein
MARITIDDLPPVGDIPAEGLEQIFGAGRKPGQMVQKSWRANRP